MKAIFLSTFKFPDNDAGSLRYSYLSKLFRINGYTPYFIGKGQTSINTFTRSKYGFYKSLKNKNFNFFVKAIDTLFCFEKKIVKEVKKITNPDDIIIITCFFSKTTNKKIINIAKKKRALVLFAIEEKFSKSECNRFDFVSHILFHKCQSFYKNLPFYKKPVIAISSYLGNFAKKAVVPFLVIPFVFDEDLNINYKHSSDHNQLRFFYAGSPGKKDKLIEMIEGFDLLSPSIKAKIKVNIFGITSKYASSWLPKGLFERTKKYIFFNGVVDRETIQKEIINSDFSILLRNSEEEFAKAGFPTKVSESLFFGVPVITNYSSDLRGYLNDRVNSIIVNGCTKEAFCESIKLAVNLSNEELRNLRVNARKTSLEQLTTKCFSKSFETFLFKIKSKD